MADTTRAVPELIARLHARAQLRAGVLHLRVESALDNFQSIPVVPPWRAACGVTGLNISFEFRSSTADDHAIVNLTNVSLTDDQCTALLPPVAAEAKTYLNPSTVSEDPLR